MSKKLTGVIALLLATALTVTACSNKDESAPSPAAQAGASAQPASPGTGTGTYTATEPINYSFDYPELWTMDESEDPTSPVQFYGEKVTVNLNIEDVPDASLDDYANAAQQQLNSMDVTVESQTDSTMGSEPAVTIVSSQKKGDKTIKLSQTFAVVDGHAFVVTYGGAGDSFDSNMGTAQAMIDSFRF